MRLALFLLGSVCLLFAVAGFLMTADGRAALTLEEEARVMRLRRFARHQKDVEEGRSQ